jgi:hypothetical protein
MSRNLLRTGVFLVICAGCTGRAFALDENRWSIVANNSSDIEQVQITDDLWTAGNVFFEDMNHGNRKTLKNKKSPAISLQPKTKYYMYFDTTAKSYAITLGIGPEGGTSVQMNFSRGITSVRKKGGDLAQISTSTGNNGDANMAFDFSAFENPGSGKAFITIHN